MKPTLASLKAELRSMTKRAERAEAQLTPFLAWSCKTCGCSFGNKVDVRDLAGVTECSSCVAVDLIAKQRDAVRLVLHKIHKALRPVLAYFGQQWIGDAVLADFQALVVFAKGRGDE